MDDLEEDMIQHKASDENQFRQQLQNVFANKLNVSGQDVLRKAAENSGDDDNSSSDDDEGNEQQLENDVVQNGKEEVNEVDEEEIKRVSKKRKLIDKFDLHQKEELALQLLANK